MMRQRRLRRIERPALAETEPADTVSIPAPVSAVEPLPSEVSKEASSSSVRVPKLSVFCDPGEQAVPSKKLTSRKPSLAVFCDDDTADDAPVKSISHFKENVLKPRIPLRPVISTLDPAKIQQLMDAAASASASSASASAVAMTSATDNMAAGLDISNTDTSDKENIVFTRNDMTNGKPKTEMTDDASFDKLCSAFTSMSIEKPSSSASMSASASVSISASTPALAIDTIIAETTPAPDLAVEKGFGGRRRLRKLPLASASSKKVIE